MKKVFAIIGCLIAVSTIQAASKSWISKLENNSPFYVTFQSTDPSAKNLVGDYCWLRNNAYIVGPKSEISLSDTVIPWQSFGGSIRISVNGVALSGSPFTTAQATIQEERGEIWIDTGARRDKIARADQFAILIAKDGTISLKNL